MFHNCFAPPVLCGTPCPLRSFHQQNQSKRPRNRELADAISRWDGALTDMQAGDVIPVFPWPPASTHLNYGVGTYTVSSCLSCASDLACSTVVLRPDLLHILRMVHNSAIFVLMIKKKQKKTNNRTAKRVWTRASDCRSIFKVAQTDMPYRLHQKHLIDT